jgi:hypothetical protein
MEKTKPLTTARTSRHPPGVARGLLLAVLVLLCCACRPDTPEAALRSKLDLMQSAAAEGRPGDFMDGVAEGFTGNEGIDRAALHNLLRGQVLANPRIGITKGPVQVEIHGDRATVRFSVLLIGGSGRLVPDRAQSHAITSGWREEQGEWRVYYAQWEPAY